MTSKARRAPRDWGAIRKLPSGRHQASYLDAAGTRRTAPDTFPTRAAADAWLTAQRAKLDAGTWRDPGAGAETFAAYAARWLAERGLKPRTEHDYRRILDRLLLPEFGAMPLKEITPAAVRSWYARLDTGDAGHAVARLRAAPRHPEDRRSRRPDRREPVPHPGRRAGQDGQGDPARDTGRAGSDRGGHARPGSG